tara:strand:- start:20270 stop:21427 length:1158 start_codon:yes stop_codon:yes gene_type:complete
MISDNILKFISMLLNKSSSINFFILFIVTIIFSFGFILLYSAAGGSMDPWATKQLTRYLFAVVIFIIASIINIKFWLGLSYYIYFFSIILLIMVGIFGYVGMGAQRWLDLGFFNLQPSELIKFSIILVLAKYFHAEKNYNLWDNIKNFIIPMLLILVPSYLIFLQPDLGSTVLLLIASLTILFIIGLSLWFFVTSALMCIIAAPFIWFLLLYDYQKNRILTFIDPNKDPLGSGYHIIQSKIALGSGGLFGKGFLEGTQSHLNFLPEMQTDFIFTLLAEEFGLIGTIILLLLYIILIFYCLVIGIISNSRFGCFVAIGVSINIFYYVFVNTAMVCGLIPVVGVPLPLVSYGGTSMLCVMFGLGLVSNVYVHRNIKIERYKDGILGW